MEKTFEGHRDNEEIKIIDESELALEIPRRQLKGVYGKILYLIGIVMVIFHVEILTYYPIDPWIFRAFHLLFAGIIAFALVPATKSSPRDRVTLVDLVWILLCAGTVIYLIVVFDELLYRVGVSPNSLDILFGSIAILFVLEMTRRTCGPVLPIMSLIFISYALFGQYLPGILWHKGYTLERTISLIFSQEGIFSIPLGVSATFVFLFVIFGGFLQMSGVGRFFIDFAFSIAGRTRGGPGKVSVVTSALFGTISGSAVANVVVDGVINIPMMKKTGFSSGSAGAIEALTSTGGQIMPPVMGAAAFLMAEITGIPYPRICVAAAIPAILYYVSAFFMIDFEAAKLKLQGLPKSQLPDFKKAVLANGHLVIPLLFIIFTLMILQLSPIRSALYAIVISIIVSWVKKETRMGIKQILDAMYTGATGIIEIAATCASAGIIIGILSLTGLGMKFASIVISYSGGHLLIALILTMLVAIVLGMGMPTTAAYAISASVIAPSLIKLGVPMLASHLFIFYFACISAITPPVALAAYAAAALAKASMWEVGWRACKFGIAGFIVPYMFVYGSELLFKGTWIGIMWATLTASLGAFCLSGGVQGWLLKKANWLERLMLIGAALLLIKPGIYTDIVGFILFGIVLVLQYKKPATNNIPFGEK